MDENIEQPQSIQSEKVEQDGGIFELLEEPHDFFWALKQRSKEN